VRATTAGCLRRRSRDRVVALCTPRRAKGLTP
jgi:hypothetical protein